MDQDSKTIPISKEALKLILKEIGIKPPINEGSFFKKVDDNFSSKIYKLIEPHSEGIVCIVGYFTYLIVISAIFSLKSVFIDYISIIIICAILMFVFGIPIVGSLVQIAIKGNLNSAISETTRALTIFWIIAFTYKIWVTEIAKVFYLTADFLEKQISKKYDIISLSELSNLVICLILFVMTSATISMVLLTIIKRSFIGLHIKWKLMSLKKFYLYAFVQNFFLGIFELVLIKDGSSHERLNLEFTSYMFCFFCTFILTGFIFSIENSKVTKLYEEEYAPLLKLQEELEDNTNL